VRGEREIGDGWMEKSMEKRRMGRGKGQREAGVHGGEGDGRGKRRVRGREGRK